MASRIITAPPVDSAIPPHGGRIIAAGSFTPPPDPGGGGGGSGTVSRSFFPAAAWFWDKIPASPVLDPNNAAVSALIADTSPSANGHILNFGEYNYPIYTRGPSTPLIRVRVNNSLNYGGGWGTNDLESWDIPIDPSWWPAAGSDHHMAVVDPVQGQVFCLWACNGNPPVTQCEWGGVYPLNGDGTSPRASYNGQGGIWPNPVSRATGAGVANNLALMPSDLVGGVINHALCFSTNVATGPPNTNGFFRYPATTSDGGAYVASTPLHEGMRFQIDPSINIAAISGITPLEVIVGKCLQDYGFVCVDNGGARVALIAQGLVNWTTLGLGAMGTDIGDWSNHHTQSNAGYYALDHIPWYGTRVLKNWHGGA